MADLTGITAVRPTANTRTQLVTYGDTVSVGHTVYLDADDNEWKRGDANSTSAIANITALAMTPGIDGGYGIVAIGGDVILVGVVGMVQGQSYVQSDTPGGIAPNSALTAGWFVSDVGRAASTTQLNLDFNPTGITF